MKLPGYLGLLCAAHFLTVMPLLAQPALVPPLAIRHLEGGQVQLGWPGTALGFVLEQTDAITQPLQWQSIATPATPSDGNFTVTVPVTPGNRFFRLRQDLTRVSASSPVNGETGVAVTRETIVHFTAPLSTETIIGTKDFYATFGGRQILSRVELSSDRTKATLFYLEPLPGSARVKVVLDGTALKDSAGIPVDADEDGNPGGEAVISFDTLSLSTLPGTAVIGKVFASELAPAAGGVVPVNKPLAGVTITVDGMEQSLRAVTDATGSFTLSPVPPGRFFVHIDGRTLTDAGAGIHYPDKAYYPAVGKAWDAVAGVTNNLAGGTGEIFLPLITSDTLQTVSMSQDTTISFPASVIANNPALAGTAITVPANSLFNDNGTRGGKVGITPVPPDRLPGPLPPGLEMPLVITVQTDGGLNFDKPAPICFPNLPDPVLGTPLPPGSKQALISFDHDKGIWEAAGSMTVSADGRFVCTDPGVGVLQPGWHGVAPPPSGPPPPSPPPRLCKAEEDAGTPSSPIVLHSHIRKIDPLCGCHVNRKSEDLCLGNCIALLKGRMEQVVARQIAARKKCSECGPFLSANPCRSAAFKRAEDICHIRTFRAGIRARKDAHVENEECTDTCLECWGGLPAASRNSAQLAGVNSVEDQILALSALMEELIRPFAEGGLPIPDEVYSQIEQLQKQADAVAGGDAVAYLNEKVASVARLFGHKPEDFDLGNAPEYPVLYVATILRKDNVLILRGETGPLGQYSLFVPRDGVLADISFYDARTRRYDSILPNANPAATYRLPPFALLSLADDEPDADKDSLPDLVEDVYGTEPTKADTDGDGIPDGAEIEQGTDPLGGWVTRTGVIATVKTPGAAVDIATGNDLAVVAQGASGVAVLNIAKISQPTIITQIDTPGTAQRVAFSGDLVAVADGSAGLAVIDIADPVTARIIHQVNLAGAQAVTVGAGLGYVGLASGQVYAVDLANGEILNQVSVTSAVQDLALDGDYLYALTGDRLLVISLVDGALDMVGSAASPIRPTLINQRLFVGGGIAYATHRNGYNTLDVTNPAKPLLITASASTQFGWRQIVANGSGLGLAAVGSSSLDGQPHDVSLYDVSNPRATDVVITAFPTPGNARAVSIFNGLAYVADDTAGLQVVNYLPYDAKGVPPTIALATSFPTNGVEETRLARVTAQVGDDVQVRNVEFYLDDTKVFTDAAFPFEFRFVTPPLTVNTKSFRLRARAVDTGGNFTWTEETTVTLLPDTTPVRVLQHSPGGKTLRSLSAYFDGPVNAATLNPGSFKLFSAGNDGLPGTADDLPVSGGVVSYREETKSATLSFASPLPEGRYRAVLTPAVADLAGNGLASEYTWQFRVADAVFWTRTTDGLWSDPLNWSTGTVPGPNDSVIIELSSVEVTVTHGAGTTAIKSLLSHERLVVTGGILQVSGGLQINKDMTLNGGTIKGGRVTQNDGARLIIANNGGNTLDGVSLNADLDLTGARLRILNGLTLSGSVLLDIGGTLTFSGNQTFDNASIVFAGASGTLGVEDRSTLTLGPNAVVRGRTGIIGQALVAGQSNKLINQGLISADVAGGTIAIQSAVFENTGTVENKNGGNVTLRSAIWSNFSLITAAGGALTLDNSYTNTGTIQANDATVNLDGDFTLARLGTFQRTGGTVKVVGVLNLTGDTLTLNATTGSWTLDGGTIRGGTVKVSGGAKLVCVGNLGSTLDGVTLNGDLDITSQLARVFIRNGLTLNGDVLLDRAGTITFVGNQTFGSGRIVFGGLLGGGFNNTMNVSDNTTLTLGSAVVMRGQLGTVNGNGTLINEGLISADVAGGTLSVDARGFTNAGTSECRNGGSLTLSAATWNNTGVINAAGTGALTLMDGWSNTGAINASGATVNLSGTFTLAQLGTFNRTGGTVNVSGVLNLTGDTLALNATTGSWQIDRGTINGGTVTLSEGARLMIVGNASQLPSALDGVTLHGDLDVTSTLARVLIRNGLTLSGSVLLDRGGYITFEGTQTLSSGNIVFGGLTGGGFNTVTIAANTTLTLGPTVVVRGQLGMLVGTGRLINQGLISADVAGGTITIRPAQFENTGTVEQKNGGKIVAP